MEFGRNGHDRFAGNHGHKLYPGVCTLFRATLGGVASEVMVFRVSANSLCRLEHICWDHFWLGDFHHHSYTTEDEKHHTLMASAYCMASAPESVYADRNVFKSQLDPKKHSLSWQGGAGIDLQSLHGLAKTLIPSDKEVAPVQVWFELASRYDVQRMTDPRNLEALKRELKGVVKCVVIGAAMERAAFESVVTRVLGAPLIPWSTAVA